MEKSYKKSCKSAIYALAIIVAGACTLAQPAFGLSCFLPSGNCGGGGVGISNQDDCSKYEISKEEYEAEYMNNCWSCSGCNDKKTNKTTYSCTLKTGSELGDWVWKNKKCCKNGNCGNCQPPLKWDDDREACVCENAGEVYHSDANMCCPSGQSPSDGMCCPSGQHNSSGHCCPRDQHYNGTECVCDEPLIGDGNGGCRPRDCVGYNLSSEYNLECFDCEKCPDDETKIKCTAKTLSSSWEVNADTGACRLKSCSDLGYLTESESCEKNKKKTSVDGVEASDGPCYSCGDQTCEQIDSSYRTSCSSSEITHPTEAAGSNGPCVTCEPDPCDSSYNQENKLDENCFSCTQCTKTGSNYENKWYCQQNIKENYIVEGTTCRLKTCKEINSDYVTECPAGYACRDTQIDGSDGDCLTTQACTYGTAEKCKQAGEWVGTCKQDSDGCWWPETCNNAKGYATQASDCGGGAFTTGAQAGKLGKDGSGAACYRIGCNESAGYYADLGSYDTTVFKESAYQGCGLTCKQPSCVNNISNQSDCKTTGSAGYDLEGPKVLKKVNCYTCKAKTCPDGYEKGKTAANCAAKEGYVVTYASSSIYAGNDVCGTCNEDKKACPTGYNIKYQTKANCETISGKEVTGVTFSGQSGETKCGKCEYKDKACPTGYNTKYQTKANCETISGKKVTGVTFNGQSGETKCGQCQYEDEDTCPTDYKADVTCGEGFTKFENPNHKGCYQCQCRSQGIINGKCTTCVAEGYTESVGSNMECDLCPINEHQGKNCKCTATCPTGYSENLKGLGSCGAQPLGWDFEGKTICGGTITCGKCTAKTCPAGTDTSKKACAYPESLQIMGYTGDKACTRCTQPTCPSGTYATQTECQKHVPTNECAGYKYGGACKKGSISGCWKPLGTMSSKAVVTCANGTCSLGFCLVSGVSNSGYYGNACVQDVQIGDHHTWKGYSESTGFSYTAHQGGISSCSVTKGRNTDCSRSTSYSSTCRASMVIGPSQWDQDDGKW